MERAMRLNKERMDKYMVEVEEWKKSTIEIFQEQINMKDKEISELRETLALLSKVEFLRL
jgi:hypothetical protein